ncbi:MAG: PKD domain-containing protein [Ferruginibacter sp.]|nr:PKD domain-containing protein [Ferruginibacter sp.]
MARIFLIISFVLFACAGYSQTVDFTYQGANGVLCSPATVKFTATATGSPTGYVWSFGNGLRSYTANPSTMYSSGSYTVKLIVIYASGTVETTKTIVVLPKILPQLAADKEYICQPGVVNFSTSSNGGSLSYEWNFGDSTGPLSTAVSSANHTYNAFGSYSVLVKATDTTGCSGMDTLLVEVKRPPIVATVAPPSGCIPSSPIFTSTVTLPVNGSVQNYTWNFGDGTPAVSTNSGTITHTYSKVGGFLPTLDIVTNEGCTNSFSFPAVAYGTPPTNHQAYPNDTVFCGSETPRFVATAVDANRYFWDFGDGTSASVRDTTITHKYDSLGLKTVVVTPYFNECPGTPISFTIRISGVIATYDYSNTCSDRKTFQFTNTTQGNQSSTLWEYGDSSPTASTLNTQHTYPALGTFLTKLTVVDLITGCTDSFSRTIYMGNPAVVNSDTSICRNTITNFSVSNSFPNPEASYSWSVVGQNINTNGTPSLSVKASIFGNFNNAVIIQNGVGIYCPDTVSLGSTILVRGPLLDYNLPANICMSEFVNIKNDSRPYIPGDVVNEWFWNYNYENTFTYDSIYQPLPYQYAGTGIYYVRLDAKDNRGCVDSLVKQVNVRPIPFLQVLPHVDTVCAGSSDTLIAFHDNPIIWSPSATLTCNNCDTVLATPATTTLYKITTTNSFNCTIEDSILVKVFPQFTVSKVGPDPYICLNEQVQLEVAPKDKLVVWSPAAGLSSSTIHNPVANPTQTTVYTATLSDSVGCFSNSIDVTVYVKSLPQVDAGPDLLISYNTPFTFTPVYSSNVRAYLWTPSTGLSCTSCAAPGGIALKSMSYTIEVTSDSGCVAKDSINLTIDCKDAYILMPKAFTPNNDNLNDTYYPITRGVKNINRFIIYNRGGQVIFEARNFRPNDKFKSWDGYFKGEPQSPGSFVYVLEAVCDTGETLKKSGSLILLR